MNNIDRTIQFLTKGCTCKKGCNTNRCRCKKKNEKCGPGCKCQHCENLATRAGNTSSSVAPMVANAVESDTEEMNDSEQDSEDSDDEIESEIIT